MCIRDRLWPSAMLLVTSMIGIQVLMIVLAMYGIKRWNGKEPEPAPDDDFPVRTGAMLRYSLKSHVSNVMTYINSYLGSDVYKRQQETLHFVQWLWSVSRGKCALESTGSCALYGRTLELSLIHI